MAGEALVMRFLHLVPTLPFQDGDAQLDSGRLLAAQGLFYGVTDFSVLFVHKKQYPT